MVVWKYRRSGVLDAEDSEACCQCIESILALPAVQEEWLRVGDYSPKAFQQELARVRNRTVTAATD